MRSESRCLGVEGSVIMLLPQGSEMASQGQASQVHHRCRVLRERGCSIGQIAKRLRLSKSTVHWHVKDISLTDAQREALRRQKQQLMARVNARRRGKPLHPVAFRKPSWSKALVHLVAHLSFDGRVDRYGCYYYSRSRRQAEHVRRLLQSLLNVTPKLQRRPNGIWMVSFRNVAVSEWLSRREQTLLDVIGERRRWQREWLKAFFDDEGHVHMQGSHRRVRASQHDLRTLQVAQRCLRAFEIPSRIDRASLSVEITRRKNLQRFQSVVNFSNGLTINPNRKNGLWRSALEKRDVLARLLASYQN